MHRFKFNFRKSVRERAAEYSARAYSHYRQNVQPFIDRRFQPLRDMHSKIWKNRKIGK